METSNVPKKRQVKKYKLPTYIVYLFVIFVGIYFFLHSSFFYIENIIVKDNHILEEEKIINLSQVGSAENLIFLNKGIIEGNILVNPLVKKVDIIKKIPKSLVITIVERVPVGLLMCDDGFVQVSEDGYFLALLDNIGEYSIPIINGISMDYLPGPGQEIKNETLLIVLDIIKKSTPEILNNLAEINMANSASILAYTTLGLEIRLGGLEAIEEKLHDLNLVLLELISKSLDSNEIEYIDLRFAGAPIIKKKL